MKIFVLAFAVVFILYVAEGGKYDAIKLCGSPHCNLNVAKKEEMQNLVHVLRKELLRIEVHFLYFQLFFQDDHIFV